MEQPHIDPLGEVLRHIPDAAWMRLVDTACDAFKKTVAPITETMGGIGRLIEAKFDALLEPQKALVGAVVDSAAAKAESAKPQAEVFSPRVLIAVLDLVADHPDPACADLWANLLAQSAVDPGNVHPEAGHLLARLDQSDLHLLGTLAEESATSGFMHELGKAVQSTLAIRVIGVNLGVRAKTSFSHEHLQRLGLIDLSRGTKWEISAFGQLFLRMISAPAALNDVPDAR